MEKIIKSKFGWKIFFSYMIVILTGILVLLASVELALPTAFDQHMANMENMTGNQTTGEMMSGSSMQQENDLFSSFRITINSALIRSVGAAFAVALAVSILISYRVVNPVREMMFASQDIARGNYQERVFVPGDPTRGDELSELAISFNRMAEQLERNENVRQRLIGDISHELRTPLTVIKGILEGLMDDVLPPDQDTYHKVHQEADRLSHLVDDLQLLSQVEAGEYKLDKETIEVEELINTVLERLGQQYIDKGVKLTSDLELELPPVQADPRRIGQVLLNIVGNALQYTTKGDRVSIQARRENNEVHITVQDTGEGIPVEHHPYIFTRFYRVDKSRTRASGGSGIGLTVARHFVEAHGGRIWMDSAGEGQGSSFTFSLPVID